MMNWQKQWWYGLHKIATTAYTNHEQTTCKFKTMMMMDFTKSIITAATNHERATTRSTELAFKEGVSVSMKDEANIQHI